MKTLTANPDLSQILQDAALANPVLAYGALVVVIAFIAHKMTDWI